MQEKKRSFPVADPSKSINRSQRVDKENVEFSKWLTYTLVGWLLKKLQLQFVRAFYQTNCSRKFTHYREKHSDNINISMKYEQAYRNTIKCRKWTI